MQGQLSADENECATIPGCEPGVCRRKPDAFHPVRGTVHRRCCGVTAVRVGGVARTSYGNGVTVNLKQLRIHMRNLAVKAEQYSKTSRRIKTQERCRGRAQAYRNAVELLELVMMEAKRQ